MNRSTFSSGGDFVEFNTDFKAEVTYGRYSDSEKKESFSGIRKIIVKMYGDVYDFTFYSDTKDKGKIRIYCKFE